MRSYCILQFGRNDNEIVISNRFARRSHPVITHIKRIGAERRAGKQLTLLARNGALQLSGLPLRMRSLTQRTPLITARALFMVVCHRRR